MIGHSSIVRMPPVKSRFCFPGPATNVSWPAATKESVGGMEILVAEVVVFHAEVAMEALRNLTVRIGITRWHLGDDLSDWFLLFPRNRNKERFEVFL
jgi:hypothetical protein